MSVATNQCYALLDFACLRINIGKIISVFLWTIGEHHEPSGSGVEGHHLRVVAEFEGQLPWLKRVRWRYNQRAAPGGKRQDLAIMGDTRARSAVGTAQPVEVAALQVEPIERGVRSKEQATPDCAARTESDVVEFFMGDSY